jgi:adenosylcobinamide-GDP ribazoletransferase
VTESSLSTSEPTISWLTRVRLAASFLTILPIFDRRPHQPEAVAQSFGWFPLIGFAIGLLLVLEDYLLSAIMRPPPRAIALILSAIVITGALHLDALADTADALGAGSNRTRALEILRDSRVGTFGAVAIFFALLIEVSALASDADQNRRTALFLAFGLSRWAMVAVAHQMTYLRSQGSGTALLDNSRVPLRTASIVALIGAALMGLPAGLNAAVIAIVFCLIARWGYRRWLGGVTGDLIGASAQIIEITIIVACTH